MSQTAAIIVLNDKECVFCVKRLFGECRNSDCEETGNPVVVVTVFYHIPSDCGDARGVCEWAAGRSSN